MIRIHIEIFHGTIIAHGGILICLVELNQLFPGFVKFFLGRKKCNQRPQLQPPINGQVTAQNEDEKLAKTGEKIAANLDAEPVKVPDDPDFHQLIDNFIIFSVFNPVGAISLNFMNSVDRFCNFI